jgi:hypothetical protein
MPLPPTSIIKLMANKKDVPYQSLVKMFLDERVRLEFGKK